MTRPTVAVVVCAYTLDRWDDLVASLVSAAGQTPAPDELLLVVDHDDRLLERVERELSPVLPTLRTVPSTRKQGLSGARNTGLEQVASELVAFLDDDAAATDPQWLARLTAPYDDPTVIAVGGAATPRWSAGEDRPVTLPLAGSARGELDWVVGCTYEGQPSALAPVRNLMGCNMSFRRAVFAEVGGFNEGLGRVGRIPLGCEETELCIRAADAYPGTRILFEPAALVRHHVSPDRRTWRYLVRRCYAEGLSKAAIAGMVGQQAALATERGYATRVLPRAVARELAAAVRPGQPGRTSRVRSVGGASAVVLALTATVAGYLRAKVADTRSALAAPAPDLQLAVAQDR